MLKEPLETVAKLIPNVLTIAGIDPSGGAGVLADVKTMSALGAYACAVVAALTAQNTQMVSDILPIDSQFVAQQMDTLMTDVSIAAVKIGMLGQSPVIEAVANSLAKWKLTNVVLDPVMVAKSGDHLLDKQAVGLLIEALFPQVFVITPNLPEAGVLLGQSPAESVKAMYQVAEKLRNKLPVHDTRWVYLKGGHLPGDEAHDLLFDGDKMISLTHPRIQTKNTHGTGCTLSAALAALLPQSSDVPTAAKRAKAYLTQAIMQSNELQVGSGHGPVHHFHRWW